jgi:hypothetical protein
MKERFEAVGAIVGVVKAEEAIAIDTARRRGVEVERNILILYDL